MSATPTHRWLLSDGQKTNALGCRPVRARSATHGRSGTPRPIGSASCTVSSIGDGSWNKQEIRSGEHLHYVQLYGERVAKFRDFFDQVELLAVSRRASRICRYRRRARRAPTSSACFRRPPTPSTSRASSTAGSPRTATPSKRARGVFGRPSTRRSPGSSRPRRSPATSRSALVEEGSVETSFGVRSRSIRWLYLATRESHWRVMSVEPQSRPTKPTRSAR